MHTRPAVTESTRSLRIVGCVACGGPSEVTGQFSLPAGGGTEAYVRTRCIDGHVVVVPSFVVDPA